MYKPLILIIPLLLTSTLRAQDPAPPPMWPVAEFQALLATPEPTPEARANTARLIRDLTADNYQTREAASKELATKGPAAFPGLREAVATSTDAELVSRTVDYFNTDKLQVPPNVPAATVALIKQYEVQRADFLRLKATGFPADPGHLISFIPGSIGEPGELFFRIVSQQETNPEARRVIQNAVADRFTLSARLAIAEGKFDEAEAILRRSMEPGLGLEDYIVLRALREGPRLDVNQEIARLPADANYKSLAASLMYRLLGDFRRAGGTDPAIPDGGAPPDRRMLIETGRYAELAKLVESDPKRSAYDIDHILAYLALGDRKKVDDLTAALTDRHVALLIRTDHAEDAIAQSSHPAASQPSTPDPFNTTFHLLCAQLRIREAIKSVANPGAANFDIPRHLIELHLNSASDSLLQKIQPSEPVTNMRPFPNRSLFAYADLLNAVGRTQEAAKYREQGMTLLEPIANKNAMLIKQWRDLLEYQRKFDPNEKDESLSEKIRAAQNAMYGFQFNMEDITFGSVAPDDSSATEAYWWFSDVLGEENLELRPRYDRIMRLMQGNPTDDDLHKLVDDMVLRAIHIQYRNVSVPAIAKAVNRFHAIHHDDAAVELVKRCVSELGDPSYWSVLGDIELQEKHSAPAASYYVQAAVVNLTDATLMYRLGLALSLDPKRHDDGQRLLDYAPWLVLGNHQYEVDLADTIRKFQGDAAGDQRFDPISRKYGSLPEHSLGDSFEIARDAAEAKGDYAAAFDFQKKLLFSQPHPRGAYNVQVAQMSNIADFHRLRALDALTRKDFPTLADALDRHLNNAAPDIDLLEKTLPALRTADPAASQKILTRALERLKPVVEDYPEATQYKLQLTRLQTLAQ